MNLYKINLILLLSFISLISSAQITVVKADQGPAANGDGLYYYLPETVFKVDVDLKVTERIPGPLADYCENYLGTADYLKESSVDYSVVNVEVNPLTVADENSSYYIVFSEKSSKEDHSPAVLLTPMGILKSVNIFDQPRNNQKQVTIEENKTIILGHDNDGFSYDAQYNRKQKIDTVIRKITIDTMTINKFLFKTSWVDKSKEERADEAARQIRTIRESRMNLLTGYHEVNFGESLVYMDKQLQKLEQQYLELFLGKERLMFEHHTFFVTPEKEKLQQELLSTKGGDKLVFKVKTNSEMQVKPMGAAMSNVIFYRVPAQVSVTIEFEDAIFYNDIFSVSQLGVVTGVSVSKAGVIFDVNKGEPIEIRKY